MPYPAKYMLTFILSVAVAFNAVLPAIAQTPQASPVASPVAESPSYRESECMYDLPTGLLEGDDLVCGWVTAPMYPEGSGSGVVELPVIRIHATTDTPAAEPLVILLGGPGQNMSAVLPMFGDEMPLWRYMLDRQDVILFDQRGMGQSIPSLACGFEGTNVEGIALGFGILRCGKEITARGINPAAFTTKSNAADIDAIRIAMGYDQVDLYGISYGTKLVLSFIRDYPDSVRASIIASPLPLEQNPFVDQAIGFDHALSLVWDACATDAVCAAANPDPANAFLDAVDLLARAPMQIQVIDPSSGSPIFLPIDGQMFMQIMYLGVFVGPLIPMLPYLVTTVAHGDSTVLEMTGPLLLTDGGLTLGALFTYFCQDETPFAPASSTRSEISAANLAQPIVDGT